MFNGAGGTHLWVAWTSSSPSYTNYKWCCWWTVPDSMVQQVLDELVELLQDDHSIMLHIIQYKLICALTNPASFNLQLPNINDRLVLDEEVLIVLANNSGYYGGWAGWNWWVIFICEKQSIIQVGLIESKWWNGGNGWSGNPAGGGGGGGGQWWVVILIYVALTAIGTSLPLTNLMSKSEVLVTQLLWANWNTGVTIQIPITI